MKALIAATALVLSIPAVASAAETPRGSDMIASGPIFAYNTSEFFYCEFINFGTTSVTPTAQQVFEDYSTTALNTETSCANGTPIAPNTTCYIQPSQLAAFDSLSCKVTFSGPATNVRGVFQLYDSNESVLGTAELR